MSAYPSLARLLADPVCEICHQPISCSLEKVCMNPSETIYAHQECIQVNCLYCTRSIPKILKKINKGKAVSVVTGPAIQFAHVRCYQRNTNLKVYHKIYGTK